MAYVPFKFYPVYCATKAAIHYLAVGLRSDLAGTNVNIIEFVPPYVDTDLDAQCREQTIALMGGRQNWHPPMALEEYMSQTLEGLAKADEDGKPLKEVSVGFGVLGAGAWRGTFGPISSNLVFKGKTSPHREFLSYSRDFHRCLHWNVNTYSPRNRYHLHVTLTMISHRRCKNDKVSLILLEQRQVTELSLSATHRSH
jgi:hypothetical protein